MPSYIYKAVTDNGTTFTTFCMLTINPVNLLENGGFESGNDGTWTVSGNGGAINWMASSGTIVNSNLTNNNAYYGGGIYFGGLSNESIITRCIFTDNHAKYN